MYKAALTRTSISELCRFLHRYHASNLAVIKTVADLKKNP